MNLVCLLKDHQDQEDQLVLRVPQVYKALLVHQVTLVKGVHLVALVSLVLMV